MRAALALARRGLGTVWPNPAVGCVIVKDGRVVGRGWTQPGGRPHGETEALAPGRRSGARRHRLCQPRTVLPLGPDPALRRCADRRRDAPRRRRDRGPRPARRRRRASRGCARPASRSRPGCAPPRRPKSTPASSAALRARPAAGHAEARHLARRPHRDRGAARANGSPARRRASARHLCAPRHDAIMVGTGTVLADDPQLTCRLPGLAHRSPVRVVVDGRLRIPPTARVIAEARAGPDLGRDLALRPIAARREALPRRRREVIEIAPDAASAASIWPPRSRRSAKRGITRLLVEGGARSPPRCCARGLVDRLVWFHAPMLIGGDGIPGGRRARPRAARRGAALRAPSDGERRRRRAGRRCGGGAVTAAVLAVYAFMTAA